MFVAAQRWTPRVQGNLGEASAVEWFAAAGALVFWPMFPHPDYDLIANFDERLVRVQVKTSTCWRNDRWEVTLATRGGNQSWSGLVKLLDASRCDALFVHVGDGRRWYLRMSDVEGRSGILLGGPKYADFEVDPGRPLPPRPLTVAAPHR
ncbi:MAG: group I intron-associated PD-(D/E)XK endonuclease [Actinomycetota bacterium]|nr:group I intron-associated PD-(D/E)XK endonuclease [Actinomycetota bacterium]